MRRRPALALTLLVIMGSALSSSVASSHEYPSQCTAEDHADTAAGDPSGTVVEQPNLTDPSQPSTYWWYQNYVLAGDSSGGWVVVSAQEENPGVWWNASGASIPEPGNPNWSARVTPMESERVCVEASGERIAI